MADYMVDVKGRSYKIGITYSTGDNYENNSYCSVKGDIIPVYEWARSEWRIPFEHVNDYFYAVGTKFASGRVMFLTAPENGYISAICFFWYGDTYQSVWGGSQYPPSSWRATNTVYPCDFFIAQVTCPYNAQYDYSHWVIDLNSGKTWLPNFWNSEATYDTNRDRTSLSTLVDWRDGSGGGGLNIKNMMMPNNFMVWYAGSGRYDLWQNGFLCKLYDSDEPDSNERYKDYSWLQTGETTDTKFYIPLSYGDFVASYGCRSTKPLSSFLSGYEPPSEYPFEEDYNDGGGGTGDYRDTSDTIPIDGLPTFSALSTGFINAYQLSLQEVIDLHSYLMSGSFLDNVKKLMNDPIDYIISLMMAPYVPETGANTNITVGGVTTSVSGAPLTSGYKLLDCGSITLSEFWGKYLDYNPYTKIQIYLPFIGIKPLDVDDVMSATVGLTYRIDVLTGACVATVSVSNTRGTNGALYYFNGNCHNHIPVSGKNYLEMVSNVLRTSTGLAGSLSKGDALGIASGAMDVMRSGKEIIEHSGELQGAHGLLANYTPFLIVSRPSQSLAQNYKHYKGYISNITAQLATLTGYTEVAELVQTNIHCTLDEFDEINELLKEGVYL